MNERIDFFISHSHVDKQWAEWIANCLEQAGYSTFLGERDLKVGDNFVLIIQEYIEKADRLVAVFSPSYFSSTFCQAEISAMLAKDKSKIIPVKVSEVQPVGDWSNILYVDLYNVEESEAKDRLLKAIVDEKIPHRKAEFPGARDNERAPEIDPKFPGTLPINNFNFNNDEIIMGGDEKVKAIRQALSKNNTVSSNLTLSGLGGTGKTVIARKYVYQFGYLYDLVWWIDAQSYESILFAYEDFADKNNLLIANTDRISPSEVINIVKRWMSEKDKWLFVFDNAVDFDSIQSFIPKKHKGNVLITSRYSLWKNSDVSEITVDVFSTDTAIEFLKVHGVIGKDEDLATLTNALGNLPASLQKAAKCIVENNLTVIDFLKQYNVEENNTDSSNTYVNIASVYKEQGDYSNALKFYYKSLEILQKKPNSNCINVYNSIASVYQELGEYDKAEEIYHKVLNISLDTLGRNSFGIDNFDVGTTYNNLATIF
jgi:tetratricopeptide (TPR) repeat protein